jgi:WD40 repeat protein/serine/threonine protein kinase
MNERAIFMEALEKDSLAQRSSFLDEACAGDPAMRRRVEALLGSLEQAGSFLGKPVPERLAEQAAEPRDPQLDGTVDESISERAGTVIGPYKLMEQIGEGGMGLIFVAEQQSPVRRKVAIKVIKPGMDTRDVIARFEAERQALALMDHPNIARVFDAGATATGRPYFVMELVRGVGITQFCDENRLTPRERLELFIHVCEAVQHAHQKGIIHRDLKATNILVTLHDGTPVVKVIDFGVAKAIGQQLTDKTIYTRFAQMIGTPMYMSPEQAEMSGLDIDTRSDIYALGVLLYELLTGATPFDRERLKTASYDEIRRIVREEEPPRPSQRISTLLNDALTVVSAQRRTDPKRLSQLCRGELDWIVMKALEKDRNLRYETASAFAADVQRYLKDEQVLACPPSALYRFRKFARRNTRALATVSVVAVALLLTVVGLAASTILIAREQETTEKALKAETEAKRALKDTFDRQRVEGYFRRIALAYRELSSENLGGALKLLSDCPQDLRQWEWHYLMRLCRVEPLILRDTTGVSSIAFSADGIRLASAGGDGAVKVWNTKTGKVTQILKQAHDGAVISVAFHPAGDHLASVGVDKKVKVWDLTTEQLACERPCDAIHSFGTAHVVAFNPVEANQIASGSGSRVMVWNWKTGETLHTFSGIETDRINVEFSRDGRRLASGNWDGGVKLWDPQAGGGPLRTFTENREIRHPIAALSFSPDGRRLAAASFSRRVHVWDTTTGEHVFQLPHKALVMCVAFSPDGRLLASAGEDKTVHVWDASTGLELLGLRGHTRQCGCLAFSPDGLRLASASLDKTIRIWDATPLQGHERQEALNFAEHSSEIWTLAVNPQDGRKIASAGFAMSGKVWDVQTGQVSANFGGNWDVDFCVAWHPDGRRLASAGGKSDRFTVKVWNAHTFDEEVVLPDGAEIFSVAFSPKSGQYLVTGSVKGKVQVWDAADGKPIRTLGAHKGGVRGVAFSAGGEYLASASHDGEVKVWDATRLGAKEEPQDPLRILPVHVPGPCLNVAFSPDGKRLAIGDEQYTVKIWDVVTGKELQTLRGHYGDVYTVAFSPDPGGRWIASAGEDSSVKVWDSRTGKLIRTFRGHTALVTSLAFTPDGDRLVSGGRDHKVKVWDMTPLNEMPDR